MTESGENLSGKLYIVGMPIGNPGDLSPRAEETLRFVDFVVAEDERVTKKILQKIGAEKETVGYLKHTREEAGPKVIARLLAGESCALVSDCGMPVIADPGQDLIRLCHENGVPVGTVPGPSAIITAVALSGLEITRFSFEGFLTVNKPNRRKHLEELKNETKPLVFYESPKKLAATLHDLFMTLGDRKAAIVNDLTKPTENVVLTTLAEADGTYDGLKPKGEFVIIIE